MSSNGLGYVADIVQHVGGRALQIVAPLVVGARVAVGIVGTDGITSLTDGRRCLGHDALCMLHHVHLPLEITHSRFQLVVAAAGVHVHVLGASQRSLLAGRGGGTAAGVIATATLQIHHRLLREVIAYGTSCCLIAATPNAAIAAALRCAACAASYAAAVAALAAAGVARLWAGCATCGGGGRVATAATAAATALGAAIDAVVQGAMHIQLKITRTAAHFRKDFLCSLVSLYRTLIST